MNLGNPFFIATLALWVALEYWLRLRDMLRGKRTTPRDRGTRLLIWIVVTAAIGIAVALTRAFRHDSALWLPGHRGDGPLVAGLVIVWAGLALRIWSVATLGAAFRLTVDVETGQQLVERGPYRRLRHPSYTGLLLITAGFGVVTGVWPALVATAVFPTAVLVRRIQVEEQALVDTMGEEYREYERRTWRIVPGVW